MAKNPLLVAFLVAAFATSEASAQASRLRSRDKAAAFEAAGFKRQRFDWIPCRSINLATGRLKVADLNDDRQPEAWIQQTNGYCYGSTATAFSLLTKRGDAWVVLLGVPGVPVALKSRTRGWRDIQVVSSGGGVAVYRFNGRRYVLGFPREGGPQPVHAKGGLTDGFVYGGAANDVLRAGIANDLFLGDKGDDLYIWERGNGDIAISDNARDQHDRLQLLGVASTEVSLRRVEGDVVICVASSATGRGGEIMLQDVFVEGVDHVGVDTVEFGDGVQWSVERIRQTAGVTSPASDAATCPGG